MDVLTAQYASQPIWLWLSFPAFIGLLLWLDLGLLNRKDGAVSPAESALRVQAAQDTSSSSPSRQSHPPNEDQARGLDLAQAGEPPLSHDGRQIKGRAP